MSTIARAFLSPIAAAWQRYAQRLWFGLPHPTGAPVVHSPGPNADRLLLLGSGLAMGYGVLSHDLALGGHLSRRIQERTGRGVQINIVASPDRTLQDVPADLEAVEAGRFDAIVLTFGGTEAATPLTPRAWRHSLGSVLALIDSLGLGKLHTFVVGLPYMTSIRGPLGLVARRRALARNRESQLVCGRLPNATFLSLDHGPSGPTGVLNRDTYNHWATVLASQMSSVLDVLAKHPTPPEPRDEVARQAAVDAMQPPVGAASDELDRILTTAQQLFGVASAAVTVIDGDLQVILRSSGPAMGTLPRAKSLCAVTILDNHTLAVPDLRHDRRFRGLPWVKSAGGLRFYAGYPLEAPGGERIGAFCLIDTSPREFSEADDTLLRELALRAQTVLWKEPVNPS